MSNPKIVQKLRIPIGERRKLKNPNGPAGRLMKLRQTVTALIKHERIELNYQLGDESRGYAERLISDAIQYGEKHKTTMDMASYWLLEKQLVHKLFKVLAPRYVNLKESYTVMWKAPNQFPGNPVNKCLLELRNNIFPKLTPVYTNQYLLHNMLLDEARKASDANAKLDENVNVKGAEKTEEIKEGVNSSDEQNQSLKEEAHDDTKNNLKL